MWWEVSPGPLMFWGLGPPDLAPGLGMGGLMVRGGRLLLGADLWPVRLAGDVGLLAGLVEQGLTLSE